MKTESQLKQKKIKMVNQETINEVIITGVYVQADIYFMQVDNTAMKTNFKLDRHLVPQ